MSITGYRRPPKARAVAWVADPWTAVLEDGSTGPLDLADVVLYADADAAEDWFDHRIGRLRRWEERRIAWVSPEGVTVRLLHDTPEGDDEAAAGLFAWADWLRSEGVGVPSSMGSTGLKLLKATMHRDHRLTAWTRDVPAFVPLGGRIGGTMEVGPWTGEATLVDLPGAYATTLGDLIWEGEWRRYDAHARGSMSSLTSPTSTPSASRSSTEATSVPTLVEARVTVPSYLRHGPLPVRPVEAPDVFDRIFAEPDQTTYPTGVTLRGIWTAEEVSMAVRDFDCDVTITAVWSMARNADARPFAPWLAAVQRGRTMPGFAGTLAKRTGNATVGALCQREGGGLYEMAWDGRKPVATRLRTGGAPRHHLLFETVTGRVRARLGHLLHYLGPDALLWHTDGAWATDEALRMPGPRAAAEGWRRDAHATAIDHLSPFCYAYTDGGVTTTYVMPGVPEHKAAREFDESWSNLMKDPARRRRVTPGMEGRAA